MKKEHDASQHSLTPTAADMRGVTAFECGDDDVDVIATPTHAQDTLDEDAIVDDVKSIRVRMLSNSTPPLRFLYCCVCIVGKPEDEAACSARGNAARCGESDGRWLMIASSDACKGVWMVCLLCRGCGGDGRVGGGY